MGPAQFIASTWNILKSRIASALGTGVANPWSPKDAITASAIYLGDLGASTQGYTAERNAACRYYSGRKCDNKKPSNSFYGNSVMSLASKIQDDIDYLKKYGISKR
jgi:membrane-bound lytic murein transglycosylase B